MVIMKYISFSKYRYHASRVKTKMADIYTNNPTKMQRYTHLPIRQSTSLPYLPNYHNVLHINLYVCSIMVKLQKERLSHASAHSIVKFGEMKCFVYYSVTLPS